MSQDFHSSGALDGVLASISYLGNTAGGSFCGYLFRKFSAKAVISRALTVHMLLSVVFATSPRIGLAIAARFFLGFTQSLVVVYTPVWVDEFSPRKHKTTWMALAQAGVPIGIMLGYLIAGLIAANSGVSWRVTFFIKSILLVPIVTIFYVVRGEALQGRSHDASRVDGKPSKTSSGLTWRVFKELVSNPLYTSTVFALCSLYFVVTALQLWVTAYLRLPPIAADLNKIVAAFGLTSATGPVLGVVLGGVVLDRIGGYQEHPHRAAYMGTACGTVAVGCALASLTVTKFWPYMILAWCLLFFGGAIVPSATGLLMVGVAKEHRNVASSLAAMTFSLFGYFLGPFLCGTLAQSMGLRWGFRAVMSWSGLALFSMIYAAYVARRRYLTQPPQVPEVEEALRLPSPLPRSGLGEPTEPSPVPEPMRRGSHTVEIPRLSHARLQLRAGIPSPSLSAEREAEEDLCSMDTARSLPASVTAYDVGLNVLEGMRHNELVHRRQHSARQHSSRIDSARYDT